MSLEALANNTLEQWRSAASRELESAPTRFFIDGDYVDPVDGGDFLDVVDRLRRFDHHRQ